MLWLTSTGRHMHRDRSTGATSLALLYAIGGALCAVTTLTPGIWRMPATLAWSLAAAGAVAAVALHLLRERVGPRTVHVAVAVLSAFVGLLTWRSTSAVAFVVLGPAVVALGLFTTHFLSRRAARTHLALAVALSTAGAAAAEPSGVVVPWLVMAAVLALLIEVQAWNTRELRRAAGTDPLTGLANRRTWETEANRSLAHALRTGEPLTVALLDLDDFKRINDEQGHNAGDALLRTLAGRWTAELRGADSLGRYGGDEFVLNLPDTDAARAEDLLARLRSGHPAPWSAGTATARPGDTLTDLLERADAELYRAKRARRG
jgi:diguanylate cyclase (GGDEF)-like protein